MDMRISQLLMQCEFSNFGRGLPMLISYRPTVAKVEKADKKKTN